jgi:hypothetical protein
MDYIKPILALLIASAPIALLLLKVYFKNKDIRLVNGQNIVLRNHTISNAISHVEFQIGSEFYIDGGETKQQVFQTIMLFACKIWREELLNLIDSINLLCPQCHKCNKEQLMSDSRNIHLATFARARMRICDLVESRDYNIDQQNQLRRAMQIFNEAEQETMNYTYSAIDKMHNLSNFNFCIKTVTANILTVYETMIVRMVVVVDEAVITSNGYFKDKTFKNSNSYDEEITNGKTKIKRS